MADYVLYYDHPEEGRREFKLQVGGTYRIGSKTGNDIVIPQPDVSRRHAMLKVYDGSLEITDLSSKNGTFVNGHRVVAATISCGDELRISSARLVVQDSRPSDHGADALANGEFLSIDMDSSDTGHYRAAASVEDMVGLLEKTAAAVQTGGVGEPLAWALERFGLDAVVVLYRDPAGGVGLAASAGDVGPVLASTSAMSWASRCPAPVPGEARRLRLKEETGRRLLVVPLDHHVMILTFSGLCPAAEDIRALVAAVEACLTASAVRRPAVHTDGLTAEEPTGGAPGTEASPVPTDSLPDGTEWLRMSLGEASAVLERWMIARVLDSFGGNRSRTAHHLGLSRPGLLKKMRRLGLASRPD